VQQSEEGSVVVFPAVFRQELDTIIVLELDGPAAEVEPKPVLWPVEPYAPTAK